MDQNYKNHTKFSPLFHFILIPLSLLGLVASIRMAFKDPSTPNILVAGLFLLIIISSLTARESALKAQDKAILAQEQLRYFILTGKQIPNDLTISQVIALRFASDAEFIALTDRSTAEKLSGKDIKLAIKNWRADNHRA